jgi:hypothetical protein
MSTTTKITRAEAIRRFRAATHVTIVARSIRGKDAPTNSPGTANERPVVGMRKEVARVSGVGVTYMGGKYPTTRFADGADSIWQEDEEGRLVFVSYAPNYAERKPNERIENARITYELEPRA